MVAVLAEDLHLVAGTELHLRRLHDGKLPTAEFVLQVVMPKKPLTDEARAQAKADRLDGSAVRVDPRDG